MKAFMVKYSFLVYRNLYNFVGRLLAAYCSFRKIDRIFIPDIFWIDLDVWHTLKEHPCHRAADAVRHIYFCTGMVPKPEYMYLLDAPGNAQQLIQPDNAQ